MKQGSGSNSSKPKSQPVSHAVNPKAVAELGIHQARTKPVSLMMGRGAKSPGPTGHSTSKSGSQGKH
jgi:hypothetical protein